MSENEKGASILMDEFLLKTIIELKVTLSKIESDADEKSDILHDVTDSLTAIAYNIKEFRDRMDKMEHQNIDVLKHLELIQSTLSVIQVMNGTDLEKLNEQLKELKYAIQNGEKLTPKKADDEKSDFSSYFTGVIDAIKNVRLIFIIMLVITLVLGAIFGDGSKTILDIIKAVVGAQ
jgi:chromosome segregation ATPase